MVQIDNNDIDDSTIKKVKNGISYKLNGWTYVAIKGDPKERGYAYGYLVAEEMKEVQRILNFMIYNDYGVKWDFFIRAAGKYFKPKIQENEKFNEYYEEMLGFSEGCTAGGTAMSVDEVIAWNNLLTLTEGWWANMPKEEHDEVYGINANSSSSRNSREGGASDKCSAFIATGPDWTEDGKIVCCHNNFSNFLDGQLANVVIDIKPTNGHRILMMGFMGWCWSGTDFYVSDAGIITTETTIGGHSAYEDKYPISCRIRHAVQYGDTLDNYVDILLDGNSGDYANQWYMGDINTDEIMRLELGLRFHKIDRTKNGYFVGYNAVMDPQIRNIECKSTGIDDIRRHQGARKVRLHDLMDKHKGKINLTVAKEILSDHYDVYLKKENPCSRTICSHYEMDAREYMSDPSRPLPFQPRGALDGNFIDSTLAKNMQMELKWGSSCQIGFDSELFFKEHREWEFLKEYVKSRPVQPYTIFGTYDWSKEGEIKEDINDVIGDEVGVEELDGGNKRKTKQNKTKRKNYKLGGKKSIKKI